MQTGKFSIFFFLEAKSWNENLKKCGPGTLLGPTVKSVSNEVRFLLLVVLTAKKLQTKKKITF